MIRTSVTGLSVFYVFISDDAEILELLLTRSNEFDLNATNSYGDTALVNVSMNGAGFKKNLFCFSIEKAIF